MAKKLNLANNPLASGPAFKQRVQEAVPYKEIPLDSITRDPNQPRVSFDEERIKELSESIKTYGVLTPILVRAAGHVGNFRLISGERRFRASKMAGLKTIPAVVTDADKSADDTLAIQIVENLQRVDLSPLERAHAFTTLKEAYDLSIREVASKLGVSKSMVQRSLDLLELPDDLLNALRQGASESKILMIAKVEDPEERARLLKGMDSLTRDAISSMVENKKEKKVKIAPKADNISPEDERIVDEMQRSLGLKVKIARSKSKEESGKLTIDFYNDKDLQEVFRKLIAA